MIKSHVMLKVTFDYMEINKKQWIRTCPKCGKEIICKSKKYFNLSNKIKSACYSCAFKGRPRSLEYRAKISNSLKGRKLSEERKRNVKLGLQNMPPDKRKSWILKGTLARIGKPTHNKGKPSPKEWRMKIRNGLLNMAPELKQKVIDGNKQRKCSDETRRKMRLSRIKYIEKTRFGGNRVTPRFSIEACKYFDKLNKDGWNLQHALNGGEFYVKELGYWLDAYDKNKNIVMEYDEGHHNQRKEADKRRMNEIKSHLNCRFFRCDAVSEELKEY